MTLEEAKNRLTYINHAYDYGNIYSRYDLEAIDTVLKALEEFELLKENYEVLRLDLTKALKELGLPEDTIIADELVNMIHEKYIPKEKVKELMEKLNHTIKNAEPIEAVFMIKQQQILDKLLLGE